MGDTAAIPSGLACAIGQNIVILRSDGTQVHQRYLRWAMRGPRHQREVAKFLNMGAVFDSLNCSDIPNFEIPVPGLAEQRWIADALDSVEAKIDSNRQCARVADDVADTLFEQIMRGNPDQKLIAHLTGDGLLKVSDGYRTRADQLGSPGIPILRVADLGEGHFSLNADSDRVSDAYSSGYVAKCSVVGDVVITTKGTVGRVALIRSADPQVVYSPQICFLRSRDPLALSPALLHRWARSPEFLQQAKRVQDQTDMAAYVSLRDLNQFQIPVVHERRVLNEIDELDHIVDERRRESRTLAALRDALLPELLSGRLRVPEAEELVSDVV